MTIFFNRNLIRTISILAFLLSTLFLSQQLNATSSKRVIEEKNFAALGKLMKQQKKGLMLMLHAEGCSFCEVLEEDYIHPMVISGEYDDRFFIRKLQIDSGYPVIDFSGHKIDRDNFVNRYEGQLTPTLLFLDGSGNEAALKLIGYNTPSLFGGYIENQLDEMYQNISRAR